jgi:quercetin dioxygenase-like cupin family protein
VEHRTTDEIVGWGQGDQIAGTPFRTVVGAPETEGRLVVLAVDMPPMIVVDEHVHDTEDQVTIVIDGRVGCSVDGVERVAGPGGVLIAPKGTRHRLWNADDGFARVLELYTPAGFEQVFAAAGARAAAGTDATGSDYEQAVIARRSGTNTG